MIFCEEGVQRFQFCEPDPCGQPADWLATNDGRAWALCSRHFLEYPEACWDDAPVDLRTQA